MANYLPVLLVSVTSNPNLHSVPDDTSIETLPRGQVDYLSHNWAEEDVWRSWRNMTRQKNEIANGMRLENASWRTWWKQRNKLKTVTPETLNWLKDSDVTWLYGPLHTAVDWTPPPKLPTSPVDRLDLSSTLSNRIPVGNIQTSSDTKYKSILKYRSISELLMNDFPATALGASPRLGMTPGGSDGESDPDEAQVQPKRPSLSHTKSDTHVATLASTGKQALAAMGLRKDSPPRIGPLEETSGPGAPSPTPSSIKPSSRESSQLTRHSSPGSLSPDSSSRANHPSDQKKKQKHIAFNTFVQQCIAIEQPKKPKTPRSSIKRKRPRPGLGYETSGTWNGKTQGTRWAGPEDEDDDEERLQESRASFHDSSDSSSDSDGVGESPYVPDPPYTTPWYPSESAIDSSDESDDVEPTSVFEDDDDELGTVAETQRSRQPKRSQSEASTSSSSSPSTSASAPSNPSTAETSPSPDDESSHTPRSRRRRSSKLTAEITLHHRLSTSSQSSNATIMARRKSFSFPSLPKKPHKRDSRHDHVTIAPIAPTFLKVAGVGNAWDGFGSGYGHHHRPAHSGSWTDGFGDEFSDDDAFKWFPGINHHSRRGGSDDDRLVELVYVPDVGRFSSDSSDHHRLGSSDDMEVLDDPETVYQHEKAYFSLDHTSRAASKFKDSSVPIVVRTPPVTKDNAEEDAYDYFAGPDLGEDFMERRSYRNRRKTTPRSDSSRSSAGNSQDDGPRDTVPSPSEDAVVDPPVSPTLLSPQFSNRSSFLPQDQTVSRGRSSTRAPSSSLSDRERSSQSSPIGSLSPEGGTIGISHAVYGVYANGRIERERERDKDRPAPRKGRERGRERTERRLDHSISPDTLGTAPPLIGKGKSSTQASSPCRDSATDFQQVPQPVTPTNSPILIGFAPPSKSLPISPKSESQRPPSASSPTHLSSPSVTTSVTTTPAVPDILLTRPSPVGPRDSEGTLVGKAVGMVSSAGQFLGLWPSDGPQ